MNTARPAWLTLLPFVLVCYGIAAVSGLVTAGSVHTWYPTLAKPFFNPPDWVFAPVWTVLYGMIAGAGWRLWRRAGAAPRAAWSAYALQLAFNFAWSLLFFGAHRPLWALIDITLLWLSTLATIVLIARRDETTAWWLVPYFAWVSYAFLLNAAVVKLN